MTRFIMSLEEAVDLVLFAFQNGANGDILVQKAPACTIQDQAQAVLELFDTEHRSTMQTIGIRHGEKMYETLLTNEECSRVPCDNRGLNYDKYVNHGDQMRNTLSEFNSNNTTRLTVEQVKQKLLALPYIQEELKKQEELR